MTTSQIHEAAQLWIPLLSLFLIIGSCGIALRTIRIYGTRGFITALRIQAAAVSRSSHIYPTLIMLVVAWIFVPRVHFSFPDLSFLQYILLTAITIAAVIQMALPPVALLLATSQKQGGGDVLRQVFFAIAPLKVATLLRGSSLPNLGDAALWTTRYRTIRGVRWENQVSRLLSIVPLVIYDTRFATPHMSTELEMLQSRSRQYALFIIHEQMDMNMEVRNAGFVKAVSNPLLHVSHESLRYYLGLWLKMRLKHRPR